MVLSQTAITLATGSSVDGRLLAQTALTIDGSTVVEPQPSTQEVRQAQRMKRSSP